MTIVTLSDEDARAFTLFQQYHENIIAVIQSGILGIKNGNATIHFNSQGHVMKIETNMIAYQRKNVV